VDGKPFLVLASELRTNTATSPQPIWPLILEAQTKGYVAAAMLEELTPSQRIRVGDYTLQCQRRSAGAPPEPQSPSPHGIYVTTGPEEFYTAGSGLIVTFEPHTPGAPIAGLGTVEEGCFVERRWVRGRSLAGEDTGQGKNVTL